MPYAEARRLMFRGLGRVMENDEYRKMYDIEKTYWWFLGKQHLIGLLLSMYLRGESENYLMLDVGCGTGIILELMNERGIGYGIELSEIAIQLLKKRNLDLIVQSDANQAIPFKNDIFSIITCLDVLEHLENDVCLLKEMHRVCKPGGFIIITVPAMRSLWSEHDKALHHKRRYSKKQLLIQIAPLNCTIIKDSYFNSSLFLPIAAARKIKSLFKQGKVVKSDFFMALPNWLNTSLYLLYSIELNCLKFITLPFGLSALLIIQKPEHPNANKSM